MDKLIVNYKENNLFSIHKYFVTVENIENGNSIELEFKTKKIVLFEKRKIRKLAFNEINNSVELQKELFNENKNQNDSLNKLLISTFKAGKIYEQR